jgi:hypothetical protein
MITNEEKNLQEQAKETNVLSELSELKDIEQVSNKCFDEMTKLNPKGGIRNYIRLAVNYGAQWQASQSPAVSQWVKVSENTPNDSITVIVSDAETGAVVTGFRLTDGKWRTPIIMNVTHWQELPLPPKD